MDKIQIKNIVAPALLGIGTAVLADKLINKPKATVSPSDIDNFDKDYRAVTAQTLVGAAFLTAGAILSTENSIVRRAMRADFVTMDCCMDYVDEVHDELISKISDID